MFDLLPAWALKALVRLTEIFPGFHRLVNRIAINRSVGVTRTRPHPWSTVHDYVSWDSLTDMRYSARHLPARNIPGQPETARVADLFRRPAGGQRLSAKSTCLFPAFAQYLTDGFIRTRMPNSSAGESEEIRLQNTSNHQIDLSPLYGRTREQTRALRLMSEAKGERGRLKSQVLAGEEWAPFLYDGPAIRAEFAVLDPPLGRDKIEAAPALRDRIFAFGGDRANSVPQVSMMNTLFLREHNRIAGMIERAHPDWDDERVFQTARNVVIVMFIKLVVEEYINHISPVPIRLMADPRVAWRAPWNRPNWITTEFSLLYRWHSLMPDEIRWGTRTVPIHATFFDNAPLLEGGLARGFADMSAQATGVLGPRNTADALLGIEESSIRQGRLARLDTYAAYRALVGLKPPRRFEDISTDPDVLRILRGLYPSPDLVEFYPGLFAEDPTPNTPLPPLIRTMVAVDAFSQALTNPLLSEHVWRAETFTAEGMAAIEGTATLADLVARNAPGGAGGARIAMTQEGWEHSW
ncbi:hypothetical protein J5Y09_11540 [Roseomonas sp. PWR1]|uniref:Heme peroxidase n=1 Tax=Roseomonas nitratireducens TaxID=2820810 RepID=A0ABS4AT33_9PROT|nr:peroxidase family protein [Neoroseomonas nitratireducens]MBP0464540.1 hypothetical protein [Neoroseomonas nitratireducens]